MKNPFYGIDRPSYMDGDRRDVHGGTKMGITKLAKRRAEQKRTNRVDEIADGVLMSRLQYELTMKNT
jgi:hypothetical protein|tara:strand:+ start:96 stop:296 length:201 start_codon:yes stop_codon:yes gene_type:complete